jgi:prevent-host-death family protein
MSAKEAEHSFGALIDAAQREPVAITRQGHGMAVVLSVEDFARFAALEDAHWGRLASVAMNEGSIGVNASERLLRQARRAED